MSRTLPPFPSSFVKAREVFDAAWLAERSAWQAMGGLANPPIVAVMAWHGRRGLALQAQAAFDLEVEAWRRLIDPV